MDGCKRQSTGARRNPNLYAEPGVPLGALGDLPRRFRSRKSYISELSESLIEEDEANASRSKSLPLPSSLKPRKPGASAASMSAATSTARHIQEALDRRLKHTLRHHSILEPELKCEAGREYITDPVEREIFQEATKDSEDEEETEDRLEQLEGRPLAEAAKQRPERPLPVQGRLYWPTQGPQKPSAAQRFDKLMKMLMYDDQPKLSQHTTNLVTQSFRLFQLDDKYGENADIAERFSQEKGYLSDRYFFKATEVAHKLGNAEMLTRRVAVQKAAEMAARKTLKNSGSGPEGIRAAQEAAVKAGSAYRHELPIAHHNYYPRRPDIEVLGYIGSTCSPENDQLNRPT